MASLVLAPQGLLANSHVNGVATNYATEVRWIKSGYTSAIGFGDVVRTQFSGNVGYIQIYSAADTHVLGVFAGCEYFNTSINQWQFANNWPSGGVSTSGDIKAYIITDPQAEFTVQVNGGPATMANIGQNCELSNNGAPNTTTGISTASVTGFANTATLPLRVIRFSNRFFPGYDPSVTNPANLSTQPTNNWVDVTFNTSEYLQTTGS